MAVLRVFKGSILEENIARTAGSIGESVAAGAVFTLPAFVMVKAWDSFDSPEAYWKSTALMLVGSVLGVLFVSLIRRVMVEDPELPFPESVAASEVHKAGQGTAKTAKYLFYNIGFGAVVFLAGAFSCFAPDQDFFFRIGQLGKSALRLGPLGSTRTVATGGVTTVAAPSVSPAYIGVGYIIGPELAALNFSGSVIAWGLLIPLFIYFLGPQLQTYLPAGAHDEDWLGLATAVWRYIVRPIAVGSMMVGTCYTLFRMRKNLIAGLAKAVHEVKAGAVDQKTVSRTERYMSSKTVFGLIGVMFLFMCVLYIYMTGIIGGAIAAALVMLIVGFFFATVSGYLVGVIGSSNNPISGLTLSTLIIAALLMVTLGVSGKSGVVAVLGVAAVVCVSSAVAGELLQDFKVGYILGGTPRTIQIVELIAVVLASCVMYFPLLWLHVGNINKGGIGFGDKDLSAPQAGLMASLAQGIVGGDMAWPLVITGHSDGHRDDHVQSAQPDAGGHRHVPADRHDERDFRRRHDPLDHRFHPQTPGPQRSAERARGKRRHPGGERPDRRRSAGRTGDRLVQLQIRQTARALRAPVVPDRRGSDGAGRAGADSHSAGQRRRSERARSAGRYDVGMRPRDTSPEAWKVLMDLMRKMSPEEKLQRTFEFSAVRSQVRRSWPATAISAGQ